MNAFGYLVLFGLLAVFVVLGIVWLFVSGAAEAEYLDKPERR